MKTSIVSFFVYQWQKLTRFLCSLLSKKALLFDAINRSETRPKRRREPFFDYYNTSARTPVAAVRDFLQEWFDSYPACGKSKKDLASRFRSPVDSQHSSALWELYLHELFSGMGFLLEPSPNVPNSANHPDFLVFERGIPRFYLEATVAGLPSQKDAAAESRLAEVLDLVDQMATPNYFLEVRYRGMPNTPPPVRKLRNTLEKFLGSQNLNDLDAACRAGDFESLPRMEWSHDGCTLFFAPIPKSPAQRGTTAARPIGVTMGEGHWLSTDQDIRDAVELKAKKYGVLSVPLIVAVNVLSEHCDEIDISNALFGSETFLVNVLPNGSCVDAGMRRKPNGIWFGPKGPRNGRVDAVLLANGLNSYSFATETPVLYHNPYLKSIPVPPSYSLPQRVPDLATDTMKLQAGKSAKDMLRLPSQWPPEMD